MMLAIPETKCTALKDFIDGQCIPCPIGSVLLMDGSCDYCDRDEYFEENKDNYFMSECKKCPLGTVGGQGTECVPCEAGTIWDDELGCKPCD